jgi:hypothetical protein
LAAGAAWTVVGAVLFTCYLHLSRTAAVDSDGAANALQAWDMLHGNLLLRGWRLSDVSFYTTELPQYMLIELARGNGPDVVHVAGAMTYTLLVLLAALLAKGRRTGPEGLVAVLITAGIMLAPQPGAGVFVVMLAPDHVGTSVPVLLTWLLLDRAPRACYVAPAVGLLLAWALVADRIVLIIAVLPLMAGCAAHAYATTVRLRRPLRAVRFELSLAAAVALATAAATVADRLISASGGFVVAPLGTSLASFSDLPQHLQLTVQGLLLLFGADFFSHRLGFVAALAMLHVVGLLLAAWATRMAVRQSLRGADLVTTVLAAAVLLSLAAYLFGQRAVDIRTTREFTAVLPFGAVLAGRLLAAPACRTRMAPAVAMAVTGYLISLGRVAALPPVPAQNQQLAGWLAAHRLSYGLAGYWQASSTTLASGGRVSLRPVVAYGDKVSAGRWESQASWYDPAAHDANFVVLYSATPDSLPYPWLTEVRATFGPPALIYRAGSYTVLVWDKNLLADLH